MDSCPHCNAEFGNDMEVAEHVDMVHADVWRAGGKRWPGAWFSDSGDEDADGTVPPTTAHHVASEGNRLWPHWNTELPEEDRERGEKRARELAEHPEDR